MLLHVGNSVPASVFCSLM